MPRHKSAVKRTRQNAQRAERNKMHTSKMKTLVKKVRSSKVKEEAAIVLKNAIKYLDQLASKGVIHKNKASNQKSKLTKFVKNLS
jgi:small subunit ribosomal protein S20